jgi:hypothetical protein
VPNVTLNLTGDTTTSTTTDGSGNYQFSSLAAGGSYTVTPTKAALTPGSDNINTVDVIAVQRHFLGQGTPLTGCRLAAANVNADSSVDTSDVIAIQRFFNGFTTGISNTGQYPFTPANRSYPGIVSSQTGQDTTRWSWATSLLRSQNVVSNSLAQEQAGELEAGVGTQAAIGRRGDL